MTRRRRSVDPPPRGAPAWTLTYAGLMTQLLVIFVVLYSLSGAPAAGGAGAPIYDPGATQPVAQGRVRSLGTIRRHLGIALSAQKADRFVRMEMVENRLIIHFDAALLFDSGSAVVKQEAIAALDAIGRVLASSANHLTIEGHTDNDPLIPSLQFPDNWMLSDGRARGVMRFFGELNGIPWTQMSIAGYADTRPIASNDTPAGKAKNRRVDIVVLGR